MRAPVLGWCLALLALGSSSCEEYGPRIYTGRLFRLGARCLEPYTPIGVVQAGELHANCSPQCLSLDTELYISEVCSPLPARADALDAGVSATCALALTAFEAEATCGAPDSGLDSGLDASALESSAGP